jgi:hypothetical protein
MKYELLQKAIKAVKEQADELSRLEYEDRYTFIQDILKPQFDLFKILENLMIDEEEISLQDFENITYEIIQNMFIYRSDCWDYLSKCGIFSESMEIAEELGYKPTDLTETNLAVMHFWYNSDIVLGVQMMCSGLWEEIREKYEQMDKTNE